MTKTTCNTMLIHNSIRVFALGMLSLSAFLVNGQVFNELLLSQGDSVTTFTTDGFGSGVSFYDFNQDGWDDVSFAIENDTQVIYQNNQGILERTNFSIFNSGETKMLLWVDYDNDGDLDVFLTTKNGQAKLLMNNGAFSFTDVTISAGISTMPAANFGVSFGDYDKDGDLDLYLCRYIGIGDSTNIDHVNNLYQNNGDGTFTNVTWFAGVSDGVTPSFCSVWMDYNQDDWPDLYVVNDRHNWKCRLYENNQDGTFTDRGTFAGVTAELDNPMTASFADFDNDQDLDLFLSNTSVFVNGNDFPRFFINQNDGTFNEQASTYGLELLNTTWGGLWIDYDNNGLQDLYVATDFLADALPPVRNYFLKNEYPSPFVEDTAVFQGLDIARNHAVAKGDLNRDGFSDVAVHADRPSYSLVFENSTNSNNFIRVSVEGTISNKMAIGTWIHVFVDSIQYSRHTYCGINYLGQNSQHQIFGLADATLVDSVHVEYLSGIVDKYYDLAVNQEYTFIEGETQNIVSLTVSGNSPFCEGDSLILQAPQLENYLWSTGDTTPSIVIYNTGIFQVQGTDSFGLTYSSVPVEFEMLNEPTINLTYTDISCANVTDGAIFLDIQNNGLAYEVTWSNNFSGDSLFNLGPNLYVYQYIDTFLCSYSDSVELFAPAELNIQSSSSFAAPGTLATLSVLVNGGVPPYEIYLDSIMVGNVVNNLDSGIYLLEIMDANSCYESIVVDIAYLDGSDTTTALVNLSKAHSFNIYPNPFAAAVYLKAESDFSGVLRAELLDVTGRKVWSDNLELKSNTSWVPLNISKSLKNGMYLLRLNSEQFQVTFKLLHE